MYVHFVARMVLVVGVSGLLSPTAIVRAKDSDLYLMNRTNSAPKKLAMWVNLRAQNDQHPDNLKHDGVAVRIYDDGAPNNGMVMADVFFLKLQDGKYVVNAKAKGIGPVAVTTKGTSGKRHRETTSIPFGAAGVNYTVHLSLTQGKGNSHASPNKRVVLRVNPVRVPEKERHPCEGPPDEDVLEEDPTVPDEDMNQEPDPLEP